MTQKQIEELKKLCLSCGDKYVRVDYEHRGVTSKIFLRKPHIIEPAYCKELAIESFDSVEISYLKNKGKDLLRTLQWWNQRVVLLDKRLRIYKTPFSAKAVKRIVDNIFNNKLK